MSLKKLVEAALFISGNAIPLEELQSIAEANFEEVEEALEEIKKDYENRNSPIKLSETADGYKFSVRSKYLSKVKDLAPQMDLGRALLRTLSFIAYKQPITQADLVKKFGNRVYNYVKELKKRGLIRAEKHKRTKMLTTTRKLVNYLGEKDLERIQDSLKQVKKYRKMKKEEEASKEFKKMFKTRKKKKKKPEKNLDVEEWTDRIEKEKRERKQKMMDELDGGRKRGRKEQELEEDLDIIFEEEES